MTELHIRVESLLNIKLIGKGWERERKEGRKKKEGGEGGGSAGRRRMTSQRQGECRWNGRSQKILLGILIPKGLILSKPRTATAALPHVYFPCSPEHFAEKRGFPFLQEKKLSHENDVKVSV